MLLHGDCLEVMRTLPDASVDAVVTDPPYGLTNRVVDEVRCAACHWVPGGSFGNGKPGGVCERCGGVLSRTREVRGGGFMGKAWDGTGIAFDPATWVECLRVLKPGGYVLAFGGTRTYHRMACAIEDAGFVIKDSIHWIYGSGFPKSLDIGKALDKRRDDYPDMLRVVEFLRAAAATANHTAATINDALGWGSAVAHHFLAPSRSNAAVPTWDQWEQLRALLSFGDDMDAEVWRLNGRKGQPGEAWHERDVVGPNPSYRKMQDAPSAYNLSRNPTITAPATDLARQWDGYGTALKPAHEPIVVAQKPLSGTYAANVAKWGCGGLNIDGCRISSGANDTNARASKTARDGSTEAGYEGGWEGEPRAWDAGTGRWPANLALSEDAARALDAQSGVTKSGRHGESGSGHPDFFGMKTVRGVTHFDEGGASRFFLTVAPDLPIEHLDFPALYCAKASRAERNAGLEGLPERPSGVMQDDNYRWEYDGKGNKINLATKNQNHHPTVKPLALMRWLVRLVTPPGGVCLDPFLGSGTTGVACVQEGRDFIGIEREESYYQIAERRIAAAQPPLFAEVACAD